MLRPTLALATAAALALSGCGGASDDEPAPSSDASATTTATEPSSSPEPEAIVFTQDEAGDLAAATEEDGIEGAEVKRVAGQIFNVQRSGEGVAVQAYTDPLNSEGVLIFLLEAGAKVKSDDYIRVSGTVYDIFEGENSFGTVQTSPRIDVTSWKKVSASALDPAVKTYRKSQTRDLGGVAITVQRVEISENETRIKVRYRNNAGEDFVDDLSLVADGEEVEESYNDGNKEPASSVSPGASTSGTLTFETVDPDAALELTYSGYDYDYNDIAVSFTFSP